MRKSIGFIVLAAGQSRRFGSNKLLLPVQSSPANDDVEPMIVYIAKKLRSLSHRVLVVCRQEDSALHQTLDKHQIAHVSSPTSAQGMGHSLAFGIQQSADWDGWLICLGDMPLIQTQTYQSMMTALEHHTLVAPVYQGEMGKPVGFAKCFYQDLITLQGDQGARVLLNKYRKQLHYITSNDPGIVLDIDQPEHLERLKSIAYPIILPPFS